MGGFVIYLANTGQMTSGPEFQVASGRALAGWFASLEAWLAPVPEPVLGLGLLGLAGVFIWATLVGRLRAADAAPDDAAALDAPSLDDRSADPEPAPHCH